MRGQPGKIRSLIAGIAILIVAIVGAFLIGGPSFADGMPGSGTTINIVRTALIAVGLIGAGLAFYNAFKHKNAMSRAVDNNTYSIGSQTGHVCPNCGNAIGESDRFCRSCGTYLHA